MSAAPGRPYLTGCWHGGWAVSFLLRIEDTDTKRNTPTAMQQVLE
jgi:hypothetical protein